MKVCTKCKVEKAVEEFGSDKNSSYGKVSQCKVCAVLRAKEWYELNKERVAAYKKKYRSENTLKLAETGKEYYAANKEKLVQTSKEYRGRTKVNKAKTDKEYREKNRAKLMEKDKKYRENNKDKYKAYFQRSCTIKDAHKRLLVTDEAEYTDGNLTVVCKMCGKRFQPTNQQVQNRIRAINGGDGEGNFYCSDACKGACPVYNFKSHHTDPRSNLYVDKSEAQMVRGCQTGDLKKLQCDEFGYTYCEKCGDIIDVELHHTLPVADFGSDSIDSSGHILLCAGCHTSLHAVCN